MQGDQDLGDWMREIQHSERPEIDKLREYFGEVTGRIVAFAEKQVELARAMQDREAMVKQQVKLESIKTAREIFAFGYHFASGRKAWDEPDKR